MNSQITNETVRRIPQTDNEKENRLSALEFSLKEIMASIVEIKAEMKKPVDLKTFDRVQMAATSAGVMEQRNSITALNLLHQYINKKPIQQLIIKKGPDHEPVFLLFANVY